MTQTQLSPDMLAAFAREGVLRLPGLLSPEALRHAREAVLQPLAALDLWRDGAWKPETWRGGGLKLKTPKAIGNKHPELRALLDEPKVRAVAGALLHGRNIDRSLHRNPQVLFTLPNAEAWRVPAGWHVDFPRLASGRSPGVQMFAFLDVVEPGGGGTMVVTGSHRLLNQGRHMGLKQMRRLLRREPFFRDLWAEIPRTAAASTELMGRRARMSGVELGLLELTGAPGDIYVTDLRLLHSIAPNASDRPRLMLTDRLTAADVIAEIEEAFGWR